MSTFRFRLATLLKLREKSRDERRRELADGLRALETLQGRIAEVDAQLNELKGVYGDAAKPGQVILDKLLNTQRFEAVLRAELNTYQEQTQLVQDEIQRRRNMLIEADREVRVLEKLREKQLARHEEEQTRQEMKVMDELAGRIYREAARP